MTFLKLYITAIPVFFLIDMVWLGLVTKKFYQNQIGSLLKENVNWIAAIVFYFIFVAGIVHFVILPAVIKQSWQSAVLSGAFFGFVCYATYDLTNLAVTKDWPLTVTVVDMIWGAVLTAAVSGITYVIAQKIG